MSTFSIDFNQVKKIISQYDLDKKIELIKTLEKETFPQRFKTLLDKMKTDEISLNDITSETELIREKRYNAGKKA